LTIAPLLTTPSQTVGPFFSFALPYEGGDTLVAPDDPEAIRIEGIVRDGAGEPLPDALVELWQANRAGRYAHPEDAREELPLEDGFTGFGRCGTDADGRFAFTTVKPGRVPGPEGSLQAPHIDVSVFARGLLNRLVTRIYFPDEVEANGADAVLASVDPARRSTLVAVPEGGLLRFDVNLQGDAETVFFAL
jgi:protocatechuate 3,4-dioxygenase alpha subunit